MTERPLQDRASRLDRRTLLSTGAVVGVGLLLPGRTHADDTVLPRTGLIELSSRPQNYESPLEVFTSRLTPTSQFYIRSHGIFIYSINRFFFNWRWNSWKSIIRINGSSIKGKSL